MPGSRVSHGAIALAATAGWTAFSISLLNFDPGFTTPFLSCMRLVGRFPPCEAAQVEINAAVWQFHTLPMLVAIVAGYVAIAILFLRARVRSAVRTSLARPDDTA